MKKFHLAKDALNEINYEINSKGSIEFDEEELNNVLEELDLYQKLKRKFATDTQGLVNLYQEFLDEKNALEDNEIMIDALEKEKVKLTTKATQLAEKNYT